MFSNPRFPTEITVKIAHILYSQEFFVELESLIYVFPELTELFDYKVPTIILIDNDQYKKCNTFLHSRKRPFGSKDLFIIQQKKTFKSPNHVISRHDSKIYMVLGSKRYQELIPRSFKRYLGYYVDVIEQHSTDIDDDSYKCYELKWSADGPGKIPLKDLKEPSHYSCDLGTMLDTFLSRINPRLLRFESYSGKCDLFFEWEQLYGIYRSYVTSRYPADKDLETFRQGKDCVLNIPKCSFELIKDFRQLTSLYQYSSVLNPGTLEITSSNFSEIRWLKRKLGFTAYYDKTTAFFNNVKNVTVTKTISNNAQSNSHKSFISIDCSRSATPNTSTYQFLQNYYFYFVTKFGSRFQRAYEDSTADHDIFSKELMSQCTDGRESTSSSMDLFYLDFSIEKLQSVEITFLNTEYKYSDNKRFLHSDVTAKTSSIENLSMKELECNLNRVLHSIEQLHMDHEKTPQQRELCKLLSQQMMTTIMNQVTNNIDSEGLDKELPLKLKVFDNQTHKINQPTRNQYVQTWFSKNYHKNHTPSYPRYYNLSHEYYSSNTASHT